MFCKRWTILTNSSKLSAKLYFNYGLGNEYNTIIKKLAVHTQKSLLLLF